LIATVCVSTPVTSVIPFRLPCCRFMFVSAFDTKENAGRAHQTYHVRCGTALGKEQQHLRAVDREILRCSDCNNAYVRHVKAKSFLVPTI
jgi:hypothetical protein